MRHDAIKTRTAEIGILKTMTALANHDNGMSGVLRENRAILEILYSWPDVAR